MAGASNFGPCAELATGRSTAGCRFLEAGRFFAAARYARHDHAWLRRVMVRRASVTAPVTRRWTVALDRVHDLTMPAILAFHRNGNNAVNRRHQKQDRKEPPEDEAEYDQQHVEDSRERLGVEQQAERRQQERQDVDHRFLPAPARARRNGAIYLGTHAPRAMFLRGDPG